MYKLDAFFKELNALAPIELSLKEIERGGHDNSGIIVKGADTVKRALFSLDLSLATVKKAKNLHCDLIVTHHPAIYYPVTTMNIDGVNDALLFAIQNKMSVISMHLNLDFASEGIDHSLAEGLGAKTYKIIDVILDGNGYGRESKIESIKFGDYVTKIKKQFNSKKIIAYGNKNDIISSVASFCGGGAEDANKYVNNGGVAEVIVTSDAKHHNVLNYVEKGKKVIILPHYVAEEYGFKRYYTAIKEKINNQVETFYFDDKRFR